MAHADQGQVEGRGPGTVTPVASQGRLLARNTVLNFLGQVLPAVTGVLLVPYTIHGLGVARFGILSLAWILIGYLTLFDLGLGRATIRFVADAIGRDHLDMIPRVVWTSVAIQFVSASVVGLLLARFAPGLVPGVIKVPPGLVPDAKGVITLLSLGLPALVCTTAFKGVLEASQRFDLVNIVRSAGGIMMFAIPAVGVYLGLGLPTIMLVLLVGLTLVAAGYLALDLLVAPGLRSSIRVDRHLVKPLFIFGGWVSLSSVLVPILLYADRLIISAVSGVAVLTYYSVPFDLVSRLQVFPWSFGTALFPALSTTSGRKDTLGPIYARAIRYLFALMSPVALALILLARPLLTVWLGPDFASRSSLILELLAVGVLLNAMAQMPAQVLDAFGRPDLRAKIFLAYLPFYIAFVWILVTRDGIVGAAVAWTVRSALEVVLFTAVAGRLVKASVAVSILPTVGPVILAFGVLVVVGIGVDVIRMNLLIDGVMAVVGTFGFAILVWFRTLDASERSSVLEVLHAIPIGTRRFIRGLS